MDDWVSKSAKKRDAERLTAFGKLLMELSEDSLRQFELPVPLRQALVAAKNITSHGAKKRHSQFIGKLLRQIADLSPIEACYAQIQAQAAGQTAFFHTIETWRHRLVSEGKPALTAFIEAYPGVDVQKLRHCVKLAVEEDQTDEDVSQKTGAMKALFRFLRETASG